MPPGVDLPGGIVIMMVDGKGTRGRREGRAMKHKGTFYGIEFAENGWRVTVGMRVVCDHLDTYAEAVRWVKSR